MQQATLQRTHQSKHMVEFAPQHTAFICHNSENVNFKKKMP
jgi:hypothetical protein